MLYAILLNVRVSVPFSERQSPECYLTTYILLHSRQDILGDNFSKDAHIIVMCIVLSGKDHYHIQAWEDDDCLATPTALDDRIHVCLFSLVVSQPPLIAVATSPLFRHERIWQRDVGCLLYLIGGLPDFRQFSYLLKLIPPALPAQVVLSSREKPASMKLK